MIASASGGRREPGEQKDTMGDDRVFGNIATKLLMENDRVRIWGINLAPGQRVPFHCHKRTYFWVCTDGTRGNQRFPTGEMETYDFAVGDVDFLDIEPGGQLIHDLENAGDKPLRFIAVELL